MNSESTLFIAVIFLGVNALNSVLGVFEVERNMFWHKAALMYDSSAIAGALTRGNPFHFHGIFYFHGFVLLHHGRKYICSCLVLTCTLLPSSRFVPLTISGLRTTRCKFFFFYMFSRSA
jgi:hypothetical protein